MPKNPNDEVKKRIKELEQEIARLHGIEAEVLKRERQEQKAKVLLNTDLLEVLEGLRTIASGNPHVQISKDASSNLAGELKQGIKQTAKDHELLLDLAHEFAFGLAEHFDVLHRVSTGQLDARIVGTSSVELLNALKKVTNEMIENVSGEIRKRKKTEAALDEERKRLFSLLDGLPMYVYLQAPDHSIRFANQFFKEHFGDPMGKPCYEVIRESDRPCDICKPFQVFDTGDPIEWEWERKNGKTYQVFDYPFIDSDGTALVLELGIDITKRKEAQRERREMRAQLYQVQKMEALGILAGSIVHDFNNLLMVIQSDAAIMLRETAPGDSRYEKLKSITQEVRKGAQLLDQMLGFSRGGTSMVVPTDLNELAQKTCEMFAKSKPEVHIQTAFQENLWKAEVDPGRIEQVLLNLFINASDAMPEGGVLHVQTRNTILEKKDGIHYWVKPDSYVQITVTDQGTGMDNETQLRAFEPFFTTKPRGRGTGLGLASAYGIIKDHDGIIAIESEKGKGTTIHISLPALRPATE